jgi:L-serine dehydratase
MGPMTAAARFLKEILSNDWPRPAGVKVDRVGASLHGSLAATVRLFWV